MQLFHPYTFYISADELPRQFTWPFCYEPHPLCEKAVSLVRNHLRSQPRFAMEAAKGKMFGVLVARRISDGTVGFLAAYSGLLDGRNDLPWFVPPVFDLLAPGGFFKRGEAEISAMNDEIARLQSSSEYVALKAALQAVTQTAASDFAAAKAGMAVAKARRDEMRRSTLTPEAEEALLNESRHQKAEYRRLKQRLQNGIDLAKRQLDSYETNIVRLRAERKTRSASLQRRLFDNYIVSNALGDRQDLNQVFRAAGIAMPPSGAGECAAPKLLQYAFRNGYHPLAMAEFWWGASPETEIRQHGHFYPACKSKCEPILGHMLQGVDVEPNVQETQMMHPAEPSILYEDEWLVAVDKPAGMLSVPNADNNAPSVLSWALEHFPHATGSLVVHRLDMDTSGILLIAKDRQTFVLLQQQFEHRQIKKRYIAILDGLVATDKGTISLPLGGAKRENSHHPLPSRHPPRRTHAHHILSGNRTHPPIACPCGTSPRIKRPHHGRQPLWKTCRPPLPACRIHLFCPSANRNKHGHSLSRSFLRQKFTCPCHALGLPFANLFDARKLLV